MTRYRFHRKPSGSLRKFLLVGASSLALVVAAGCSSSGSGTTASSSTAAATSPSAAPATSGSTPTYTVGVLADMTGPNSGSSKNIPVGIQAGIIAAAQEGYKIKYILADTQSSPTGALAAAQQLVAQDHVFAVLAISGLTYNVAPYLKAKGIPVIGAAEDSDEWSTYSNMFSIFGTPNYTKVETTTADAFKKLGATNIASLGYGIVPSSSAVANAIASVAKGLGLKVGYLNAQIAIGTTNVGPLVLAIKNAGVDGVTTVMGQDTSFAILKGLREQGAKFMSINFGGYGTDLTLAGPGATQVAQNQYFTMVYAPVELHSAGTEKFVNALKAAGSASDPSISTYYGYLSVDALVAGLKAAGSNPSQAQFINAMLGITNYNAAGLFGGHTISFAMKDRGQGGPGADNCYFYTKYVGSAFQLVPGLDPICGTIKP